MKEILKKNINNILFTLFFVFRQAIFYINSTCGYFIVGNFDVFYALAPIYIYNNFKNKEKIKKLLLIIAIVLIYIFIQIIFLPNYNIFKAVINAIKIIVCFLVLLYVKENINKINFNNVVKFFVLIMVFLVVLSMIFPESILWRHNDTTNKYALERLQLLYTEPSELGFHILLILIPIISNIIIGREKIKQNIIFSIILIFALILAKPLGAICIGVFAIGSMILYDWIINYSKRKTKIYCTIIVLFIITLLVMIFTNNGLYLRFKDTLNGKDISNNYRIIASYNVVKEIILDTYGLGIGFGNAETDENVEKYYSIGLREQGIINSYINFIGETGILGILLVAYLIYSLIRTSLKQRDILKLGLTIFIITYQFFGSHFTNSICWIIYGIILSKESLIKPKKAIIKNEIENAKKNIVIIEDNINLMGGVERIVATLANDLINDNNVEVISKYKEGIEPFFEYDNNIKRTYMVEVKKISSKIKKRNLLFYIIRIFEKQYEKIRATILIKKYCKYINTKDVIIFGRVNVATDFLKYIEASKKIIVRDAIHLKNHSQLTIKKLKKYFPRKVDKFIVSSNESMETYKKFFGSKQVNLEKVYNPLGIEIKHGYRYENKKVIAIGRFDKQKGFENLIKAFKLVIKKHPDWKLELVGDGNYKKVYEKLIFELNLEKNVFLIGKTKNITKTLNEASIYVMTSRYEGYANSLVEAIACGVPSISYDWLMGVEDIIKDNENGLIVKLKNREDYYYGNKEYEEDIINLAERINYLIENEEIAKYLSGNAIEIIKTRNIEYILKKWRAMIND